MYYKLTISTFKVIQRTRKVIQRTTQRKRKSCIKSIQLYLFYLYMVMGLISNISRLIFCMSSQKGHVLKLFTASYFLLTLLTGHYYQPNMLKTVNFGSLYDNCHFELFQEDGRKSLRQQPLINAYLILSIEMKI